VKISVCYKELDCDDKDMVGPV